MRVEVTDVVEYLHARLADYPRDVFVEPPRGEHGKTVDGCSARAIRFILGAVIRELETGKWREHIAPHALGARANEARARTREAEAVRHERYAIANVAASICNEAANALVRLGPRELGHAISRAIAARQEADDAALRLASQSEPTAVTSTASPTSSEEQAEIPEGPGMGTSAAAAGVTAADVPGRGAASATDRLADIKTRWGSADLALSDRDIAWLIAEVENLRCRASATDWHARAKVAEEKLAHLLIDFNNGIAERVELRAQLRAAHNKGQDTRGIGDSDIVAALAERDRLREALCKVAEGDAGDQQAMDWPDFYDSVRRFARRAVEERPGTSEASPRDGFALSPLALAAERWAKGYDGPGTAAQRENELKAAAIAYAFGEPPEQRPGEASPSLVDTSVTHEDLKAVMKQAEAEARRRFPSMTAEQMLRPICTEQRTAEAASRTGTEVWTRGDESAAPVGGAAYFEGGLVVRVEAPDGQRTADASPEARIAELEKALGDMLMAHDGYHCESCDDRDSAYSDAEYEHPANRPEERDCDCGDVGRRLAAKAVLERRRERATVAAADDGPCPECGAITEAERAYCKSIHGAFAQDLRGAKPAPRVSVRQRLRDVAAGKLDADKEGEALCTEIAALVDWAREAGPVRVPKRRALPLLGARCELVGDRNEYTIVEIGARDGSAADRELRDVHVRGARGSRWVSANDVRITGGPNE